MRTFSPAPNVLQVTRLSLFSCHLLQEADGLTLIDTGLPGGARSLARTVKSLGASVKHILITHAHQDHCGSLDGFREACPEAIVVASERTARLMTGDHALQPDDDGRPLRGGFITCKTKPSLLIEDNERVGGFRAVFTPGHAPGHVSYFHEETGYLFTGDALHTAGGRLAVSGEFRLSFPFPYFATWSRGLALESARRLRDLRPAGLFPAHGSAILNPECALEEAIHHAELAFGDDRAPAGTRKAA
jgi:glyoxylase-like metal-dependent hydrolase (beta-lactamase superfamily II)